MDSPKKKENLAACLVWDVTLILHRFSGHANLVIPDEVFNVHIHTCALPSMTAHIDDHIVPHDVPSGTILDLIYRETSNTYP